MRRKGLVLAVALIVAALVVVLFVGTDRDLNPDRPDEAETAAPARPPDISAVKDATPEEIPPGWQMMEGIVLDAKTLSPIGGAHVVFSLGGRESRTTTDERGVWRYPLSGLLADRVYGNVIAEGYLTESLDLLADWRDARIQEVAPPAFLRKATVEIWGRLLGPDGDPVPDADLVGDGLVPVEVRTDAGGRFGPIPAAHGEFGIEVFAAGGVGWYELLRIPYEARGRFKVTLRIPAPQYVSGITLDDRGRPLPGVLLWDGCGQRGPRLSSGPDGRFLWPLIGPTTSLSARKDGYFCISDNCVYPGGQVEVILERAASIEGRVVRADGSRPPPGLWVVSRAGRCKVAEDGHFQLGRLLARRSGLSVGFPAPFRTSHRWLTTVRPELEIGEHRTGFVLELPPLAALEGLVLDARTRRPIVGAMVEEAFTDFEGRYFLPVSKKDRTKIDTRLDVVANGYLPLRTIHSAAKPIQLRPAREILVLVVDRADHPLPGTVVRVPGAEILKKGISGVTDIEGRCRVRAPAGESVVVRCLAPRHDLQEAPCAANQAELRVVIEPPDAHYTVIVRDEKGDPLSTAWIEDNLGRTHADAAGRIVMTSSRDAVLSAPGRERILLEPRSDWRNVTLDHRLREAGPIQVRFVYSDGRGVPMAWVSHFQGSGWTNADGWASIAGYARGETVVLRCDIEGWKEATYRVVAGEAPRTIRIPGRGEIIVRYAPEEADGEQPVAVCFEPGLKGDDLPCFERWSRGELHLSLEEIEAWLFVQISPGGWRFYRDLRVREGERIELDYDFPRPGRIQGRVFGPDGDALEYADVTLFEFDSHEGTTDSEGKFTLQLDPDDLENAVGMIRLLVTHDEFAPVLTEPIDLGRDQDLVVHLTRGGTLEGRVVGADGAVELTILTPGAVEDPVLGSREDGSFNFDLPIRAGHHRVRIETRSGEKYFRDAEIEDGAQTKVSFHLP